MAAADAHTGPLDPERTADEALLAVLVYMAGSDGEVDDQELAFVLRALPGRDPEAVRAWIKKVASAGPLDLDRVADALPDVEQRWTALRYGARMACKDGRLDVQERHLLAHLAHAFDLPDGAVQRVLEEMQARSDGLVESKKITDTLEALQWGAVQLAGGALTSEDMLAALPKDGTVVARIGLDNVEVMALLREGVVGRFREGVAFLRWDDVVGYSREATLAAGLRLHTEDGRRWTLTDARLGGLAPFLDRVYGTRPRPVGESPKVVQVRGGD